jgi:hypothetical protein
VIYGILFGVQSQREIFNNHCLGTCGKALCGAIDAGPLGALAVCRRPSCECLHFENEVEMPSDCNVRGEKITIRKLK